VTPGRAISFVIASLLAASVASCTQDVRVLHRRVQPDSGGNTVVANRDAAMASMKESCVPTPCPTGRTWDPVACSCFTSPVDAACPIGPCDGGTWNPTTCSCDLPGNACEQGKTRYDSSYTGSNGVTMSLASMPAMPMVDEHQTWTMSIRLPGGQPVPEGTPVTIECKMIHTTYTHGCTGIIEVARSGDVFTASPVIFNMQGDWQLVVTIGDLDTVTFGVCAQ
jgi:hypothetical protein